jgi:hypothetical protein
MTTLLILPDDLTRLRLPELLAHAAQDELQRRQVALELLRRDEKRGRGLDPAMAPGDRLGFALARLERRAAKHRRGRSTTSRTRTHALPVRGRRGVGDTP